jgi:hypothetical protein
MRRIVLGLALAIGMLLTAATGASAHTYCTVDPTLAVGVPGVTLNATAYVLGSDVYASSGGGSTTYGGSVGTP